MEISKYEILDEIGGGGMGVVYRARDRRLGRVVAIKVLSPRLVENEHAKQRFLKEARAASALDHPNVGTIHEADETPDGELYLVMAYYRGDDLRTVLDRGPIRADRAVRIAAQVAAGLEHAHQQSIVHRDIKPGNLILTRGDEVKIVDFGLAKTDDVRLTDEGAPLGTPAYMSPEHVRGRGVDARSDIWCLGVVLYEMLSGTLPFEGQTRDALVDAILRAEPRPLTPAVDKTLAAMVERALEKDPDDRFESMGEFLRALERWQGRREELETAVRPGAPSSPDQTMGRPSAQESSEVRGERRQVTVLSCRIHGYDEMSEEIDPEELHDILHAFHEACAGIVVRLDGSVERHGEELIAYFGIPSAHEDDARRAMSAALEITGIVKTLGTPSGTAIEASVGVHTGKVVTSPSGTGVGPTVVGRAPRIASRIGEVAGPGSVVASETSLSIVKGSVESEALGAHELKGLPEPIRLSRVLGTRDTLSITEAETPSTLDSFFGRENELSILEQRWHEARAGGGQVAYVRGEAGIGKSRLALSMKQRLADELPDWLEARCSPLHQNTAFHPMKKIARQLIGLGMEASPEEELDKLRRKLASLGMAGDEETALLASLTEMPVELPVTSTSPDRLKARMMETLVRMIFQSSDQRPMFIVVEDLHWSDPSTRELLGILIDQIPTSHVFLLLTSRPDSSFEWENRSQVTPVTLARLPRASAEAIVRHAAGNKELPEELLGELITKADGVPLFVEELTKAVLESDALDEHSAEFELNRKFRTIAIPATLEDSLMARLDRLGTAKQVAQVGAVVGREFSYELVSSLLPLTDVALQKALRRLVDAELLYQRGTPPNAKFVFKHALVQDSAYNSLLKSDRQRFHRDIANFIESSYDDAAQPDHELLAHHFTEAGLINPALQHWLAAGKRALTRSTNLEAIHFLNRGVSLIATAPEPSEHLQTELEFQTSLGAALTTTYGFSSPELKQAWLRAQEICEAIGESAELFWIWRGLWSYFLTRGELKQAEDVTHRIEKLAGMSEDTERLVEAQHALGVSALYLGVPVSACESLDRGLSFDLPRHDRVGVLYAGYDAQMSCFGVRSWALWITGNVSEARKSSGAAIELARELGHPGSVTLSLFYAIWFHQLSREPERVLSLAEELTRGSSEQGAFFGALTNIFRGWARSVKAADDGGASADDYEQNIELMRQGLEINRAMGSLLCHTYYLSLIVDVSLSAGLIEDSERLLEEALSLAERNSEGFWLAELHRQKGELLLASSSGRALEAERDFENALQIARDQRALSLELRAAISMAKLWMTAGARDKARELLTGVRRQLPSRDGAEAAAADALLSNL